MKIPFLSFDNRNQQIREQAIAAFTSFFDTKWYVLGNATKQFEAEFATYCEVPYCVGISNGLDALHLALKVLGVGEGDEVIVPSNTYIATVLAVSYCGAKPIFVEPDVQTYNIDPKKIEAAITKNTRAIMPVHLYGQACEMEAIMKIAEEHNLYVIEDNAQAQGATFKGKKTGSFGHLNATSFYPSKNLGAFGEAGAITTDIEKYADLVSVYRNYGSQKRYYNMVKGYNNRIDECQAALLSVQLPYLDKWNAERQRLFVEYMELLKGSKDLILPLIAEGATTVGHLFVVRHNKRDELQAYLSENGIGTLIHYPVPPHLQECYKELGYQNGDFPIAEMLAQTSLSIPLYPGLTDDEVSYIAQKVRQFCSEN
jgi:dTDP-4-amino-4,6-dideoxygalactose transaminase